MIGKKSGSKSVQKGVNSDRFLRSHLAQNSDKLQTECLYRFREPVSPHLAAKNAFQKSEVGIKFSQYT